MKRILAVIVASLLFPFLAHAECENNFKVWASELNEIGNADLTVAACKTWPLNPTLTIAALPLPHKSNTSDEGVYDLVILLADSLTNAVIAHTRQFSAITYDAVRFDGIEIDTARYQLAPTKQAFGVRIRYAASSRIYPSNTTFINLYVYEEKALRLVLNRLIVETGNGDWDGFCEGTFNATSRLIQIGSARFEGYATLKVVERSEHSVSMASESDCVTTNHSTRAASFVLPYHNGAYQVPKKLTFPAD